MEFVQQYTPENRDMTVLFMDKIRYKRGIIETLYAIIANTKHIIELREHPNMITQLNFITDSFMHENSGDLSQETQVIIKRSKRKMQELRNY